MSAKPFQAECEPLPGRLSLVRRRTRPIVPSRLPPAPTEPKKTHSPQLPEAEGAPQCGFEGALELIEEGRVALRCSEHRIQALEARIQDMVQLHLAELVRAQAQISWLVERVQLAERRAGDAEAWLDSMCQTIGREFGLAEHAASPRTEIASALEPTALR